MYLYNSYREVTKTRCLGFGDITLHSLSALLLYIGENIDEGLPRPVTASPFVFYDLQA